MLELQSEPVLISSLGNRNATRTQSRSFESNPVERPHLGFECMMRELIQHPEHLAVIADKKPHPDRLTFLAGLRLWQEAGQPSHAVWQGMCERGDQRELAQSLLENRGEKVLSSFGLVMSASGGISLS